MSQFADLLATRADAALERWVTEVQRGDDGESSSRAQLQDQLDAMLPSLILALRRSPAAIAPARRATERPRAFGVNRQTLIREFGLLGGVLFGLAEDSGAMSMADMKCFTDFMTNAVAEGVAAHETVSVVVDRDAIELKALQELFEEAPLIMCILEGPQQIFTAANAAQRAMLGGRALLGRSMGDALPEFRGQGFDTLIANVMASGTPHFGTETPARFFGPGELRYFNISYQPRRSLAGVVSVLVMGIEVTSQVHARERAEAEADILQRSEDRMRRLIEATGGGTWELDLCTGRVSADQMLRALHGFPPEGDFDLEVAIRRVHQDDQAMIRGALQAAYDFSGSHRYCVQYRTIVAGDEPRWIEARGRIYFDPTGAPIRLLGTAVDITARMAAQRAREGLLAALAAQPFMQVCVLEGLDNVVTLVNQEYVTNVAGGRDIVGRPVLDSFPQLEDQGFDVLMKAVRETREPYIGREVATRLALDHGEVVERYFNFVMQPVMGEQDHVASLLNISYDVTDVVVARRALETAAAQDRQRVDFERQLIGIVSHDLRTPLATIGLGVDVLLTNHENLAPISLRAVLRIQTTLERMVRLVNDLLDFTQVRIGTGMPIVLAPMNLVGVVRQVVEELRMRSSDREITLDAADDTDGLWDSARLEQVAHNLLTNALRYSPPATAVHVTIRSDADQVELQIDNRGAPIDPAMLSRLFEPMVRGSKAAASGRSVGLGLFIVKHIVESLGGTISVRSTAEDGTSFTVALPRAPHGPVPGAVANAEWLKN